MGTTMIWQGGHYWSVWYCEYEPHGDCGGKDCAGRHDHVGGGGPTSRKSALAAMRRCYRANTGSLWACWSERMGHGPNVAGADSLGVVSEVVA
jgi:hypothetical protein